MPNAAENAGALQAILANLGVLTVQQLVDLFRSYSALADFPNILHAAVPEVVGQHAQAAAAISAQWYDELNPTSTFHATPVVNLAPERITKSVDWSLRAPNGPKTLQPAPGEPLGGLTTLQDPPKPDAATSLSRLTGSAKRMVYDAARDTVTDNAAAEDVGWARYALPDACAFCRVLATRSGENLYMSAHSAQFVVGKRGVARGSRKIGEKYHDHCRCVPFPIRSGDFEPPDYTQKWQEQYDAAKAAGNYSLKDILSHMRANSDAH